MSLISPKLDTKTMAYMCRMLAQSSRGSVQVDRALELTMGEHSAKRLRRLMSPIIDHIKRGGTLADAFRLQGRYVPEQFLELIDAAERGGKAEIAFEYLAHDYEKRLEFLRAMTRQLLYPLLLVIIAVYVIPWYTGVMTTALSVEEFTCRYLFQIVISWLPFLGVFAVLRHFDLIEKLTYTIASRTWPWRGILHQMALVRFFRTLSMLLDAGLTVPRAIERAAATTVNPRVCAALVKAVPMVQQGTELTAALKSTRMLPELALEMVRTGEFSGRLEDLLRKTAQYIEESTTHYVYMLQYTLVALIIPALIVIGILNLIVTQTVAVFLTIREMFSD